MNANLSQILKATKPYRIHRGHHWFPGRPLSNLAKQYGAPGKVVALPISMVWVN